MGSRLVAPIFHGRGWGAYLMLKNRDEIFKLGMIDHASVEDTRLLEGSGVMLARKNFEI